MSVSSTGAGARQELQGKQEPNENIQGLEVQHRTIEGAQRGMGVIITDADVSLQTVPV